MMSPDQQKRWAAAHARLTAHFEQKHGPRHEMELSQLRAALTDQQTRTVDLAFSMMLDAVEGRR